MYTKVINPDKSFSMRRFFIEKEQIQENTATLSGQDARHLKDVLRLNVGDAVLLVDGRGLEYKAAISVMSSGRVDLKVLSTHERCKESPVHITVAQAFLKDKKMDVLLRQFTELGISCFLPFYAARSVPRPDRKRLTSRKARWEKIARESLKQCERTRLPEICDPLPFSDMLEASAESDVRIMFWENATRPLVSPGAKDPSRIFILLGPEGGFTDDEVRTSKEKGFITASLGPRILRAETASLAGLTLVQYFFGDMG